MSADEYTEGSKGEVVEAEGTTFLETSVLAPLAQFYKDSIDLVNKAHKPDSKEYKAVFQATFYGLLIMGGLGYVIKLLHYPVKEILVGVKTQ